LGRIPNDPESDSVAHSSKLSIDDCTRWLLQRQTTYMEDDSDEDESDNAVVDSSSRTSPENIKLRAEESLPKLDSLSLAETMTAGFNGRPNKIADTCYSWWNTGALSVWNTRLLQTYAHLIVDAGAGWVS